MGATIENLLQKIKTLPSINQRKISALLGSTVADAATRPFHWLYNQRALRSIVGDKEPEFWPESCSQYYHIPLGFTSCYNDIVLVSLSSLNENNGELDIEHLCEAFRKHFGVGTDYAEALSRRPVDRSKLPMEGRWLHGAMIHFLKNYKAGNSKNPGSPNNVEFDAFCGALPVIIHHAGKEDVWEKASKVIDLLNTNAKIVQMYHVSALLLSRYIMGETDPLNPVQETIKTLYPDVYKVINEVKAAKAVSYPSAVARFGLPCYLPGSFQGALLAMLQTSSYVDAVRLNLIGGGCNCGRANLVGACYGAKYGIDSIPIDWLKKVTGIEKVMEEAINVYSGDTF